MNRYYKIVFISMAVILFFFAFLFIRRNEDSWLCENGEWIKHGNPRALMPGGICLGEPEISSFSECAAAGFPIMESYPRQCKTPTGKTFIEDIGNESDKSDLIQISDPRPNQTVKSPLFVSGQARGYWFFEASFPVKIFDENNNLLAAAVAQAQGEWMTENFVPFKAELDFAAPVGGGSGFLVLEKDNPSGLPENGDELRIPIVFAPTEKTLIVKAYFNNSRFDPEASCNIVFPVERKVAKTPAIARAALSELLKGVLPAEESGGFFTSINPGVEIQSLVIENGIAKIDFSDRIESQVGGSCRVSAIRAQITETLKQFPSVREVIISVNGRTEDILQP